MCNVFAPNVVSASPTALAAAKDGAEAVLLPCPSTSSFPRARAHTDIPTWISRVRALSRDLRLRVRVHISAYPHHHSAFLQPQSTLIHSWVPPFWVEDGTKPITFAGFLLHSSLQLDAKTAVASEETHSHLQSSLHSQDSQSRPPGDSHSVGTRLLGMGLCILKSQVHSSHGCPFLHQNGLKDASRHLPSSISFPCPDGPLKL